MLRAISGAAAHRDVATLTTAIGVLMTFATPLAAENRVTVGGISYVNYGLAGVGRIAANKRDRANETFGSGSGMAFDAASWKKTRSGYAGTLLLLPDRGHNIASQTNSGTINYRARVNRLSISFKPVPVGWNPPVGQEQSAVKATIEETILLRDAGGRYLTGLDPGTGVRAKAGKFPAMPEAANGRVSIDPEAIVLMPSGQMYISDEYGPYVYKFSARGRMLDVIRPPDTFIPIRNGAKNFSAEKPDPQGGRANNRGFEGLTLTPSGKLAAILQSALTQEGKSSPFTHLLFFDPTQSAKPPADYRVPLPTFMEPDGKLAVASPSELAALTDTRFLVLCRDGGNGYGKQGEAHAASRYRRIELLDLSDAHAGGGSQPDQQQQEGQVDKLSGKLLSFIDLNDNAELIRFGLHNGAPNDRNNLSEKWESMGIVSALDPNEPDDFFLFVANDNDFLTSQGYQAHHPYDDHVDVDTMFLVYRVRLPGYEAQRARLRKVAH